MMTDPNPVYLFVGERQSALAAARGWTWADGRACAGTVHRALQAHGIDPRQQRWCNLWRAPGVGRPREPAHFHEVRACLAAGCIVVALGALVADALRREGLPHLRLRHPAARGAGRARALYEAHVAATLCLPVLQKLTFSAEAPIRRHEGCRSDQPSVD